MQRGAAGWAPHRPRLGPVAGSAPSDVRTAFDLPASRWSGVCRRVRERRSDRIVRRVRDAVPCAILRLTRTGTGSSPFRPSIARCIVSRSRGSVDESAGSTVNGPGAWSYTPCGLNLGGWDDGSGRPTKCRHARAGIRDLDSLWFCVRSRSGEQRLLDQWRHGTSIGVSATPTLFINGVPVVGAAPEAVLDSMVASHLRR